MERKILLTFLVLALLSPLFTACGAPMAKSQLDFGIRSAQKDLWDEAIFRWKKVLQADPGSAAAHNNLAVAYEKKGMLQEASQEYQLALKINPDNKYVLSNYEKLKSLLAEETPAEEEKKKSDENK